MSSHANEVARIFLKEYKDVKQLENSILQLPARVPWVQEFTLEMNFIFFDSH